MTTTIFTPTHTSNVALDWCAAQETRDALFLTMDCAQVIVAQFRLEGYTWREIANAFGVSQWTPQTWMQAAAVSAYNECPELRDTLRPYVKLCAHCDTAIFQRSEMCRACYKKHKTILSARYCLDCGVPVTKEAERCWDCYVKHGRNGQNGGNGRGKG